MSLVNFDDKPYSNNFGTLSYRNFEYKGLENYFNAQYSNPFKVYETNNNRAINDTQNTQNTQKVTIRSGKIAELLESAGYDSKKAKKSTQAAKKRAREHGWKKQCAKQVRFSLEEANLIPKSNGNGDAYRYIELLSNNKNFREIDVSSLTKAELKELSKFDGIVYVYGRGVAGYSRGSGHIEISLGNGTNGSDGITHFIRRGARVFIPVKTPYSAVA